MSGFETDLPALDAGAADFATYAERVGRISADLGGLLDSFGACWGGDAVGQSFAASHVPPSADALARLGGLSAGFGGVGERFAGTARTYREVDGERGAAFGAI